MIEKGATSFDKLCHKLFASNGNGTDYLSKDTGVKCNCCGQELEAYYCESRLFLVECSRCKKKVLIMAGNAKEAAYKAFGHETSLTEVHQHGENCTHISNCDTLNIF